ncbi:hypothetical protein F5883DRAFT_435712, partial [Diaporthe sp. PMI_573]
MQKERLFRNIGCHPHILRNQILADIDHATYKKLQSVLAGSLRSADPPTLPTSIKLRCRSGRQRAKAAERVLGPEFQWTVRLYCCQVQEEHSRFHSTVQSVANSYSFEAPYTAGEVYRQIQLNPDAAETDRKGWLSHISKCKEDILTKFLRKTEIVQALNRLLRFPGLWDGLQLGNLHKHKALHCDEEIIHYLGLVYETWDLITLGVDAFANAVDVDTVRRLEKLFPSHHEDLAAIRDLFRSNEVFTDITNKGERRSLEQSVCTVKRRISSIETLHKDMLYFSPA